MSRKGTRWVLATWSQSSSNDCTHAAVLSITGGPAWAAVVARFCAEYPNTTTAGHHRRVLSQLFNENGWDHPHELDGPAIVAWCTWPTARGPRANNSVRERIALVRTFLAYCHEQGIPAPELSKPLRRLQASHPQVLGKTQANHSANRLTDAELQRLYAACSDTTWIGSRDQLALRLLALGLRAEEALSLTWHNVHEDGTIHCIGKGGKTREVIPGPTLVKMLARWRRYYQQHGLRTTGATPILCTFNNQGRPHNPTNGLRYRQLVKIVTDRAALAGLSHVAPHTLRRSLARIMWETVDNAGRHTYQLSEIADALGHSMHSLYVTQGSYIGPLDNRARKAAGRLTD